MKSIVFLLSLATLASGYSLRREGKICELCIATLEEVKSATTSTEIEKLCTDVAKTVCAFVPTAHQDKCEQFVKTVMTDNFDIFRKFTDLWGPKEVCQMVWLCPTNVVGAEGTVCTLCADVIGVMRYVSTDKALENMVIEYLDTACMVSEPLSNVCQKTIELLVGEYFDMIRKIFAMITDEQICQNLNLCEQSVSTEVLMSVTNISSICDACTATVQELEDIVAMDDLEKILEDISGIACSLIPVKVSESCTEITKDLIDEVLLVLRQVFFIYDGKKVCQIAHLCMNEIPFVSGLEEASPGPLCLLCEDTLHFSRDVLTHPQLESAVNADIKLACIFTGFFRKTCENYADTFTSTLFDQIRKTFDMFDDHKTCVLFDFCGDPDATTVCDVCKDGFEKIKELLPSLKALITDEVDLACIAFGPLKRICIAEANKLIDVVFSIVFHKLDDVSGEGFCSMLHLCEKPALF